MPPQSGEVVLTTLYVDLHCTFSPPGHRPIHDRFEKSSYFYLHHSPASGHGRIEVANNAGTQDQDAFEGLLDKVCITYSYKKPSAVSVTFLRSEERQWQVRAFDPRQERQYMYPLQSADFYFWTKEDAQEFIEGVRKVPRVGKLVIQDTPDTSHDGQQDPLSPVVQQLEQAAISSPYGRRTASTSTAHSFPPAPPQQGVRASPLAAVTPQDSHAHAHVQAPAPAFVYNPAAPAAPEPRAHREKTPPPLDADAGTGLATAPMHDQAAANGSIGGYSPFNRLVQQQHISVTPQPQSPYSQTFSPPPASQHSGPPSQYSSSFAAPPTSPPAGQQYFNAALPRYTSQPASPAFAPPPSQAFPPPPPQTQAYNPHASISSPPPASPGYPPHFQQQQQQQQRQQETLLQNPYHYAQFDYSQNAAVPSIQQPYDIHSQVYRPTEAEASHHTKNEKAAAKNQEKDTSLTGKIEKLDKGVNRFLKKWDKKLV